MQRVDIDTSIGYPLKRTTTALRTAMEASLRSLGLSVPVRMPGDPQRPAWHFKRRDPLPGVDLNAIEQPGEGIAVWLHAPDAQQIHDALTDARVTIVTEPFDGPFGRTFTFAYPDGYQITLHTKS